MVGINGKNSTTGRAPAPTPTRSRSISSSLRRLVVTPAFAAALARSSSSAASPVSAPVYFPSNAMDFIQREMIGYGSSASVYRADHRPTGRVVSIKIIELESYHRNQIEQLHRETQVMLLCRHPNLLPVHTSFVRSSQLAIVTPYLGGGSVLDIMRTAYPRGIEEIAIASILKQVLLGLAYLHRHGHIHRDVKAGNFLIDLEGTVMLGDFGVTASLELADSAQTSRRTFVGTPCWMAPEVMEQARYDTKADIWSIGITALEMANGEAPLAKFPPLKVLIMTISGPTPSLQRDETDHKYSKLFAGFIDFCLIRDPIQRPSVAELLAHSFITRAKKQQWLVQNLLCGLAPLPERVASRLHGARRAAAAMHFEHSAYMDGQNGRTSDSSPSAGSWDFSPTVTVEPEVTANASSSNGIGIGACVIEPAVETNAFSAATPAVAPAALVSTTSTLPLENAATATLGTSSAVSSRNELAKSLSNGTGSINKGRFCVDEMRPKEKELKDIPSRGQTIDDGGNQHGDSSRRNYTTASVGVLPTTIGDGSSVASPGSPALATLIDYSK